MIDYFKIGILAVCVLFSFATGWAMRNRDFNDYKKEVATLAATQEEKVKSIRSQQELVNKSTEKEYEAKIAAVRNYYKSTSVWNNNGGSKTSGLSTAPSIADVAAAYNVLAGQCAETTTQTVALQSWIKEQMGIK